MSKNLDNSPVIIDIEGYSQRTQQTEVTDQSLETVPTTVEMPEDIEEDTKATHLQAEEPMEFFDAATVYLSPQAVQADEFPEDIEKGHGAAKPQAQKSVKTSDEMMDPPPSIEESQPDALTFNFLGFGWSVINGKWKISLR